MSALPGTIGRYQVRRELGRGMMGVVYLALDPDLGREIALKVIHLPLGASEADRSGFEQRFFSEAQSAARLTHPGIVIVHDVGRDTATGSLFMALQLLSGRTLDQVLKEKKRLDWPEALRITKRIAEALQHAHSEGVVHRDIKPANVMILPNGDPKIMDFGIAKIEASRLTATGQFVGTPLYMSPEQALAQPVDGRSDLFSLGSVLYEMLTGVPAFNGESVTKILYQLLSQDPAAPSTLVTSISPSIDHVLKRCLAKNADQRYRDAEALAQDLGKILEGTPAGGPGSQPPVFGPGDTVASGTALPPPTVAGGSPSDWSALETRGLPTERSRISRRAWTVAAGVLALGALVWLITLFRTPQPVATRITESTAITGGGSNRSGDAPRAEPTVAASSDPADGDGSQPARLNIDFEHSLKSGVLRVFVDGQMVVDQEFGGRVTRRIAGVEMRKGRLSETLEIAPGSRELRIQVSWDDNVKTERSQMFFNAGSRLRLKAKLGSMGGLRKDLSLEWN